MQYQIEEFNKNCGEILRNAIFLETTLENFISDYFEVMGSDKKKLFKDLIVYRINFERKFEIFKRICKDEGMGNERINKMITDLKFIQKIRNKVAHEQALWDVDQKMKLTRNPLIIEEKDCTVINSKLVKEIEEKTVLASKGINKINCELYDKFNYPKARLIKN